VRILFPMIAAYFEIIEARRLLDEAAESLEKDGLVFNRDIDVGIMVEVPSVAVITDLVAPVVDFLSIGTNDLIQYSLAIDRGNRQVAHLYQPLDPAILRLIKHVADVGREMDTPVYMCGEMAARPLHIPLLLGMGINELSMNPQSIPAVKRVIRSLNVGETRTVIKDMLKLKTARGAYELLRDTYGDLLAELDHH